MYLGRITGSVVAAQRAEGLAGVRLLWVQPEHGAPQVAVDAVQALRPPRGDHRADDPAQVHQRSPLPPFWKTTFPSMSKASTMARMTASTGRFSVDFVWRAEEPVA